MNRIAKFSMDVKGAGQLLGMFITEAGTYFPNATIYDHSNHTNVARGRENVLGRYRLLRRGGGQRRTARRLNRNLAKPTSTDVSVIFSSVGTSEQVTVKSRTRQNTLSHNLAGGNMVATNNFIQQVLRTVEQIG